MKLFDRRFVVAFVVVAAGSVAAFADTLVLRNGRSFTGELISVHDGRLEFQPDRGPLERFGIDDVDSIEFSERGRYGGRPGRGRDNRDSRPPGNERPSGLREREVEVVSSKAWTPTNIELRDGQELWFDSRGDVRWGPKRHDGPAGETASPRNAGRPIPNRPAAALIGKLGETGDPFFIGAERGPLRVRGRGTLFLGINDDYLQDNTGSFRVIVSY